MLSAFILQKNCNTSEKAKIKHFLILFGVFFCLPTTPHAMDLIYLAEAANGWH